MNHTNRSPLKARLDRTIQDPHLTPTQKLVLTTLILHLNTRTDTTTISNKTIAQKLGYSTPTIERAIKALTQQGYIYRRPRPYTSSITHYADIPNGYIIQELAREYAPQDPHP